MAPYVPAFLPADLPTQVLGTATGARNKELPRDLDLKRDCKLLSAIQHDCSPITKNGQKILHCQEIQRLFRRCQNGMLVETTSWEGEQRESS